MRDTEHELSQNESAIEITPLSAEDELPEAQNSSTGMVHQNTTQVGRGNHSGIRRYLLIALTLCLVIALFLVTIVLPRSQSQKPSAHPSSLAATLTPKTTASPLNVPTDYTVHTTIVNGVVYAGAANGGAYALRASDGRLLWYHKIDPGAGNAPLVSGGTVYISANISDVGPGTLYALRTNDGVELWHYTISDSLSEPLVDDGIVYATSYDVVSLNGNLVALRASDGKQLWHKTARDFSYNTPVMDNHVLYASASSDNRSGMVYALQANSGTQLWHYTTSTFTTLPLVVNDIAYLSSDQGLSSVYAVRISDGTVLWHYTMSKENGNNWANWLSIENGTAYVGTYVDQDKSYIYALRSTVRDTLSSYPEIGRLLGEVYGYLTRHNMNGADLIAAGIWHDDEYKTSDIDGEGVIYLKLSIPEGGRVKVYELPATTVASVVHKGTYNTLNQAYEVIGRWIEANGYRIVGPNREIYLYCAEPVRQDDESYVTEIQFPVAKREA